MKFFSVAIPRRLRGFPAVAPETQAFDVTLDGGLVLSIDAVPTGPQGMLLSAFVDAHVHIDKTFCVGEVGAAQGDLFAAIERMARHREGWTADVVRGRMERALAQAHAAGTRAMRTHLDWPGAAAPVSLAVFEEMREAWRGRIELQFASLTPLDVLAQEGEAIAAEVARAGGVLGAFVYRNEDIDRKLASVFALARRHGLALDFHVDEGLHADATGLHSIATLAGEGGMQGRITCAHACSLSVQPGGRVRETLAQCARGGIHLVALPTTNLYLQGAWDATPLERGVTRILEADEAGIRASLATDNVADAFYPYGSYDLMETFGLGVQVAHLAPAMDWLDSITVSPAAAMGLAWDGRIRPGCPADLVLLAARDEYGLLTPEGRQRRVYRHGREL